MPTVRSGSSSPAIRNFECTGQLLPGYPTIPLFPAQDIISGLDKNHYFSFNLFIYVKYMDVKFFYRILYLVWVSKCTDDCLNLSFDIPDCVPTAISNSKRRPLGMWLPWRCKSRGCPSRDPVLKSGEIQGGKGEISLYLTPYTLNLISRTVYSQVSFHWHS